MTMTTDSEKTTSSYLFGPTHLGSESASFLGENLSLGLCKGEKPQESHPFLFLVVGPTINHPPV